MKIKTFIAVIIFMCSIRPVFADVKEYIDSYALYFENKSYKVISDGLKGEKPLLEADKHKVLDEELEKELETKFIYVDLAECIKLALEGNYDIKISDMDVLSYFWLHKNSAAGILPSVYYNFNISNLSGQYLIGGILAAREHEIPIQSFFNIEWGTVNQGKYFFYLAAARNMLKAAQHTLEYTKDEIILNTVNAYYGLLSSKMQIEVQKINLYDRIEQLKFTQARFESGIGTYYDVKRAQAEAARAQQEYTDVINTLRLRQAELANIIGIDVFASVYPFEISVDSRELVRNDFSMEKLYNQALESREDIKAKEAEVNLYRANRSMNYTDILPAVNISYKNGHVGTKDAGLSQSNTLNLDVRLYLGNNMLAGTITKLKSDAARVKQKKLELENLKRTVKENIVNSYYDSLNAKKKIEASKVEVSAADVSLDLSLINMKAGEATFIDVIASQNLKVQAELNLIKNMIEYNKAQAQLLFDIGILSPKNLLIDYKKRFY